MSIPLTPAGAAWRHAAEFRHYQVETPTHEGALRDLAELERAVRGIRRRTVIDMVAHGATWSDVARALGMSRQGASQRYGDAVREVGLLSPEEGSAT